MPKISLKSPKEIKIMAEGGERLGRILDEVLGQVKPGISTLEIDSWIEDRIISVGGVPSFKLVPRYHWASCVGLNEEVVHSIPQKNKTVKAGDLLKIDLGMLWKGLHTDLSWTVRVGEGEKFEAGTKEFLEAGREALAEAIKACRPGKRVGDISRAIQETIEREGFHPVEVLTGHGIGRKLHEDPLIPGVLKGRVEETAELLPGMTLAIEVIYSESKGEVVLEEDGWTISTKDGKIAGLFEKTIAITESGPLILTPVRFSETNGRGRGELLYAKKRRD